MNNKVVDKQKDPSTSEELTFGSVNKTQFNPQFLTNDSPKKIKR